MVYGLSPLQYIGKICRLWAEGHYYSFTTGRVL